MFTLRFLLIRFCNAAARTVFPLTISLFPGAVAGGGEFGLEALLKLPETALPAPPPPLALVRCRLGVVTPVLAPVCVPSRRGNCTLRVSKSSSVTHSSKRLLTKYKQ